MQVKFNGNIKIILIKFIAFWLLFLFILSVILYYKLDILALFILLLPLVFAFLRATYFLLIYRLISINKNVLDIQKSRLLITPVFGKSFNLRTKDINYIKVIDQNRILFNSKQKIFIVDFSNTNFDSTNDLVKLERYFKLQK